MDQQALLLTLRLATVTTAILLVIAVPLGAWLAFSRSGAATSGQTLGRWRSRFAIFVEAVVALPLVLPPTVLGFYLLVLLGPRTPPGRFLSALFGHTLAFSFSGLVIGSVLYSLPFAVQPLAAGFATIDPAVIEAARLLGASGTKLLLRVLLPLARPALLTAAVLTFTHTVGEFGAVLMIGGGIPGLTRTLSISVYDQVQDFAYHQANQTSLLLLGLSFAALLFIYMRRSRFHV